MERGTLRTLIFPALALSLGILFAILARSGPRVEVSAPAPRAAAPKIAQSSEPATEASASVAPAPTPTPRPSSGLDVAAGEAGVTVTLAEAGGLTPRLSLSLDDVRVGGVVLARGGATPRRDEGQGAFSYDRGALVERYTVRPAEVEQDFVISALPTRGDLVVTETIESNATVPTTVGPAPSLELPCGPVSFVISRAVAIDAAGRRLPLNLELAGGRLRMTVPAAWIEAATLPIVVDPVVGGQILVAMPQGTQLQELAGGPNGWVAVWYDGFSTSWNVYAAPITATGVMGSQVTVNTGANGAFAAISYSASLNKYLVVWIETNAGQSIYVAGRFLDGNGALSGAKFSVGTYTSTVGSVAVAADASGNFLVTAQYGQQLDGAVVTSTGTVTSRPIIQSTGIFSGAKVAFSNGEYLVAWTEGGAVRARGLSTAGALLTPVTSVSGTSCNLSGIATGNSQFLVTWTEGNTPTGMGRVVTANSAATLVFATAAITISSTTCYDVIPVWSGPSSAWMVTLRPPDNSLQAVNLTPSGSVSARTQIAAPSNHYIHAAGVTPANDALVLFVPDPSPSFPNPRILAQRYNIGSVTPPPPAPTNLTAVGNVGSVSLSWGASAGATGYKIFRSQTPGTWPPTPLTTVTGTTYTDIAVTNNQWYYYMVRATGSGGESANSNPAAAEPVSAPLPAPTGVAAIGLNGAVQLTWNAVAGATSYMIKRCEVSGGYDYQSPLIEIAASPATDRTVINGITYFYRVCAMGPGGSGAWSVEVSAVPQMPSTLLQVLFVANSTTLTTPDSLLKTRLTDMGYSAVVKAASTTVTGDATGKALVVISSTVTSTDVNTKFRTVAVPVVVWENAVLDDFGMTGTAAGTDFGTTATSQTQIAIVNSGHPLAAGLTGNVSVSTTANALCWGKPGTGAVTVATPVGDPGKAVIFGYDKNATMPGLAAPARRVGLFLTDATASTLTASGKALFDAAVRWATGADSVSLPPTNQVTVTRASGGMLRVSWDPVSGAAGYIVLRSTSPTGPFTPMATGVTSLDWYDTPTTSTTTYYYQVEPINAAGGIGAPVMNTQAAPTTTGNYFALAITGRRYIHARRDSTIPPDDSNFSDYRAEVFEHAFDGTTIREVLTGVTGTWTLTPTGGGNHAPVTFTSLDLQSTVQATTVETNMGDVSGYYLQFSGSINGQFLFHRIYLEVTQRRLLRVVFRFPEDPFGGRGQTRRSWGNGSPNKFFDPDPGTRQLARVQFATDFANQALPVLQSAGIGIYLGVDIDTLKINGFNTSTGFFVARDGSGSRTLSAKELASHDIPDFINVYLVEALASEGNVAGGETFMDFGDTTGEWFGKTVILPDFVNRVTLAHEIGHCASLPDIRFWHQINGILNNLKDVSAGEGINMTSPTSPLNPLNWSLMRQIGPGRLSDNRGWLLTNNMARTAFINAGTSNPSKAGAN